MFRAQCVLAVVALYLGVVHSWDVAVSLGDQLIFYEANGTKTDTVHFKSQILGKLVYDEFNNMMLYIDKQNGNDAICGYNLYSKENVCFIERNGRNIHSIAYDPATEKIFFTDINEKSINWVSLKRGYKNNVYGNLLIKMDDQTPSDIAVDSCRGYIYWTHTITDGQIVTAQLNGSERKVISLPLAYYKPFNLVIDPQTQKMFYFDVCEGCNLSQGYLNKADLSGKNDKVLLNDFHGPKSLSKVLTISKDYIYFTNSSESYDYVWQLPKSAEIVLKPKEIIKFQTDSTLGIVANYKLDDQIKGNQICDSLSSLISTFTEVSGFTGAWCDVCENHCVHGNCSFDVEGHPKCSCNAGYTGERCEISACHGYCLNDGTCSLNENSEPVCLCKVDYSGDRCEITDCLNYCMQGKCSFNDERHPTCSCNAGYSGERCEVSMCVGYCSLNGDCSLNENSEPVCQCKGDYSGDRCEITDCLNYCIQGNCSYDYERHPTCSCNAGYSGKRCDVNVCFNFCLNDGGCSLNEEGEPVCQCVNNHRGTRCEADIIKTTPMYDLAKKNLTVADLLSTWRKPSSKMFLVVEV